MIIYRAPGDFQIGIYTLTKIKIGWEAWSDGGLMGEYRQKFPTIYAAYQQLTGETLSPAALAKARRHRQP